MSVVETIYVFDLMVWGAAIGGLAFYSYSAWLEYHSNQLEFKRYLAIAFFTFFLANILHLLNAYIFNSDTVWRVASVFDGLTLLTWSVSVSIFMDFERPKDLILPGLSILMVLTVLLLPDKYVKYIGYLISAIVLVAIVSIYINMARISVGAIRNKALYFAIGFLCLLLGRLFRSSLLVGTAVASVVTILGAIVVLGGLILLAHT